MVGRPEEVGLQIGAFVPGRRVQARREHLLGERLVVDAERRGGHLGGGGEVLHVRDQHVRGRPNVRPLHADRLEDDEADRVRPGGLRRRGRVHDLQLRPGGELCRGTTILNVSNSGVLINSRICSASSDTLFNVL